MKQVSVDQLLRVLADHEPPCISLYQPTHRRHPENQQDRIRYGNLLKKLERSLREKYATRDVRTRLEDFQELLHNDLFWSRRVDGLAVLAAADLFEIFEVQRDLPERIVVANSFHIKPLLRILQSADRFHLLCLNRHEAKLYEGNRDALDPVELNDVPATIQEALGDEPTESHPTVASYNAGTDHAARHGHGAKSDEVNKDRERFFRVVDRAILKHHSRPAQLPLLLAALPEYHTPFRNISENPFLMPGGIQKNPESLSIDELRREAWQVVEPLYLERLAGLVSAFQSARARHAGSDDLSDVVRAAVAGRVATLLIAAEQVIPGHIDAATGAIQAADPDDPEADDMLDDLAEIVLRNKGEVVVVPDARMPSTSGLAATYRF
ncbi:MAG: hypothetical protein GXY58_05550 [Planctomycetaceae bacterium]|nr:hypothetical protein [Planctomycetaceae bacterium]